MFRSNSSSGRALSLGVWGCLGTVAVCVGLSGCTSLGYSDYDFCGIDGFDPDPPPHWSRGLRPPDGQTLPHALTNKGMQIERSFGIR